MVKLLEADDYIVMIVLVIFLLINFSQQIGQIYYAIAFFGFFLYYIARDNNVFRMLPIEKDPKNRFFSLIISGGLYFVFIFTGGYLTARAFSITDVSGLIASTFSATPILFGSSFLKLVVWGIIIAIIESKFFFRTLPQWLLHLWGVKFPTKVWSVGAFGLATFIGFVFTLFHAVAKGITNNSALLLTFWFGFFSMMLVIHFQQLSQAIFLHIITNTVATMQQLNIGFFEAGIVAITQNGLMLLGAIILISWFLIFQEIPLVRLGLKNRKFIGG